MNRQDWIIDRMKTMGGRPRKTQTGLALALGIDKSRVSELISGRRGVKASEIPAMADYLAMPQDEVVRLLNGGATDAYAENPTERMSASESSNINFKHQAQKTDAPPPQRNRNIEIAQAITADPVVFAFLWQQYSQIYVVENVTITTEELAALVLSDYAELVTGFENEPERMAAARGAAMKQHSSLKRDKHKIGMFSPLAGR